MKKMVYLRQKQKEKIAVGYVFFLQIYDGVFSEYDKVSKEMKRCYQAKVTSLKVRFLYHWYPCAHFEDYMHVLVTAG